MSFEPLIMKQMISNKKTKQMKLRCISVYLWPLLNLTRNPVSWLLARRQCVPQPCASWCCQRWWEGTPCEGHRGKWCCVDPEGAQSRQGGNNIFQTFITFDVLNSATLTLTRSIPACRPAERWKFPSSFMYWYLRDYSHLEHTFNLWEGERRE